LDIRTLDKEYLGPVMARGSGYGIAIGWGVVVLLTVFFVETGLDWYDNGHLRLCLPEDVLEPPFGHYRKPQTKEDEEKPEYWCKKWEEANSATAFPKEASPSSSSGNSASDIPAIQDHSKESAPRKSTRPASSEVPAPAPTPTRQLTEEEEHMQLEQANEELLNQTVNNTENDSYRGLNRFWGNTPIDGFLQKTFYLAYRQFSEIASPWFEDKAAPAWNAYLAGDDGAAKTHRTAFGIILGVLFSAFVGALFSSTLTWFGSTDSADHNKKSATS